MGGGRGYWASTAADVLAEVESSSAGLSTAEAAARLARTGPNRAAHERRPGAWRELWHQVSEPIMLVLIGATVLALLLGDTLDATIILAIVFMSALLGFWQEHSAAAAVAELLGRVQIHVDVRRDGRVVEVDPADIVPGDVLVFNAGDVVPCDCRVLSAQTLQVDESALTGETYPRHKHADPVAPDTALADRSCALLQGSHVVSGQGEAVAVVTGAGTEFGAISARLEATPPRTSFEVGTTRLGLMLARVTALLTAAILVLNLALGRPVIDAVLYSLALAIGVTPQLLPAIVTVSLSSGARRMARAHVIVRRLNSIEDLGSMDVLCTDKTGTLTEGSIALAAAVDPAGRPSDEVAGLAALNAGLQTGFANPMDEAVLRAHPLPPDARRLAEVPFDFDRKRLSVVVPGPDGPLLVTKGACTPVLDVCARVRTAAGDEPVSQHRDAVEAEIARLSADGQRVVAVAVRTLAPGTEPDSLEVTVADETELTLVGLLTFTDPPKAGLTEAVADLDDLGIRLCILSGDNRLAVHHVAAALGHEGDVVVGGDIERLGDHELAELAETTRAFAELAPSHKERVITALRSRGHVVGYLGDGINDAGPLHLADVGISVDTAVDVAKDTAAMVLLDKDLGVVADGVRLGRQTFSNTLKYLYTTVSANFGNTASMAIASAFLPFLPMLPRQILLLNFLTDLPSLGIASDRVDPEDVAAPRAWDLHQVRDFMVVFGLLSSVFDLVTFAVLLHGFDAGATLFHTGWFVGSALTELAVLFVLRTRRLSIRSRPGNALVLGSVAVGVVVIACPFLPSVADALSLTALPATVLAALVVIVLGYVVAAEVTKRVFYREHPAGRAPTVRPAPR